MSNSVAANNNIDEQVNSAECQVGEWSEWSTCSVSCGDTGGIQFRYRTVTSANTTEGVLEGCPPPVETVACTADKTCPDEDTAGQCIAEFGATYSIKTIASGFDGPRDVAL